MSFLSRIFGDPNAKVISELQKTVQVINDKESAYTNKTAEELKEASITLREKVRNGFSLDEALPEAFALCREVSKRTLGQRHYDVQLLGGMVLHRGQIAEMRTGEGKTLTSTLAVYLNALTGKGVHVVTVNDYLARRDAVWMGQVYAALGLSVGCINHESAFLYDDAWKAPQDTKEGGETDEKRDETGNFKVEMDFMRPCGRREAYAADITYGTNNEFGFDYLRDNMAMHAEQKVQRDLHFAVIDEVDSILIDEARTPLIISAAAEEAGEAYYRFASIIRHLNPSEDFTIDEKLRAASLTEAGINKLEKMLGVENLYTEAGVQTVRHLEQALRAESLYKRDRDYVVKDDEVIIVDEFTGRLMHGRRYSEGLHQAIEAKENVKIQRESQTLATITFQNLFRMYEKLSGMTGTAATEAEEFSKIYKLEVVVIPPHRQNAREDLTDLIYKTEEAKYNAVVQEIKTRHEKGQPVLVGTISIEKNEVLGELLRREGVPHELLNAKNHEKEAQTIAQAGRRGAVTIATNMAGRGVDIVLGGNPPDSEEGKLVRELGGLFVIGTERHESRRIDNQLRGRAGRQGDPGVTRFFVSLEDDLMRIFGSDRMKNLMTKLGLPDDTPIENKMVENAIQTAQRKVEGHHFDTRKHLLEYDDVLNKHREVMYRKRNEILNLAPEKREEIKSLALQMVESEIEYVVHSHTAGDNENSWDIKNIITATKAMFPVSDEIENEIKKAQNEAGTREQDAEARTIIIERLVQEADEAFETLSKRIEKDTGSAEAFFAALKMIMLRTIDMLWVEHLNAIEHLRTGIGLQGYGQRDPLVEYKREAYRMFTALTSAMNREIAYTVFRLAPVKEDEQKTTPQKTIPQSDLGRNDPCFCGSGKKYKKCHGS